MLPQDVPTRSFFCRSGRLVCFLWSPNLSTSGAAQRYNTFFMRLPMHVLWPVATRRGVSLYDFLRPPAIQCITSCISHWCPVPWCLLQCISCGYRRSLAACCRQCRPTMPPMVPFPSPLQKKSARSMLAGAFAPAAKRPSAPMGGTSFTICSGATPCSSPRTSALTLLPKTECGRACRRPIWGAAGRGQREGHTTALSRHHFETSLRAVVALPPPAPHPRPLNRQGFTAAAAVADMVPPVAAQQVQLPHRLATPVAASHPLSTLPRHQNWRRWQRRLHCSRRRPRRRCQRRLPLLNYTRPPTWAVRLQTTRRERKSMEGYRPTPVGALTWRWWSATLSRSD